MHCARYIANLCNPMTQLAMARINDIPQLQPPPTTALNPAQVVPPAPAAILPAPAPGRAAVSAAPCRLQADDRLIRAGRLDCWLAHVLRRDCADDRRVFGHQHKKPELASGPLTGDSTFNQINDEGESRQQPEKHEAAGRAVSPPRGRYHHDNAEAAPQDRTK